jgi:putative membrane protein
MGSGGRRALRLEAEKFQSSSMAAHVSKVNMKTKYLSLAAVITAALALSAQPTFAASKSSSDATFIKHAADANMTEIKLGQIAQDKGQSQDVKDFGARMVKDHTNAGDQLKPIAEKMNVDIPDHVSAMHQKTIDRLSNMSGAQFDAAYAKAMVKDHEKVISMFENAKSNVKNDDLKKFATDTLPTLQEHLEMAKKLPSSK